jgi:hypothetical protein
MAKKKKKEVSLDNLCHQRDKALERVVEIYLKATTRKKKN